MFIFARNNYAFYTRKVRFRCYSLIIFLITIPFYMSKSKINNLLTAENQINKISEEELLKALEEIKESNEKIRKSFLSDSESMSVRAGR